MTVAPASRAVRAAARAVSTGISRDNSTTSASAITARIAPEASVRWALAPGATTMQFSAWASTRITAEPLGPGTVTRPASPTSLVLRWERS